MASFGFNQYGLVATLDHDEVQYVLAATDVGQGVAGVVEKVPGLEPAIAGALKAGLTFYFGAQRALVKEFDKGAGIYLTIPYPALALAQWWLIVPGSRPVLTSGWGTDDDGELRDEDFDIINYRVEHGALPGEDIEFVLNSAGEKWRKEMVLNDGMGGRWTVMTDGPRTEDRNGLYPYQIPLGKLEFRKAKAFGAMWEVLEVPIAHLRAGDRATFYWTRD